MALSKSASKATPSKTDAARAKGSSADRLTARKSAAPAKRHFDSLEQEAFLNLWRAYDRLRIFDETLFAAADLTPQQYNVLRLLRGEHPRKLPTLTLARRLVSRAPDVTRMVDKLEERGWLVRERPAENRRTVFLGITPAGLDLLASLDRPVRDCHRRQLGHLKRTELKDLIRLLALVREPHEERDTAWGK
ncbi:MAG TPA: MarR family transcriptional regulator [Pirellulales bacterium]|nr:MarR family transcriptional regulator [Pirellulales bacterium]